MRTTMTQAAAAATALLVFSTTALAAQQASEAAGASDATEATDARDAGSWIHVRVDESDGAQVSVNLPMSLVDVAFEMLEREGIEEEIELGTDSGIDLEDVRAVWREMRDAGDADFVDVRDGGDHVRVSREGDRVRIQVDEEGKETVRLDLPAGIVDALLGTEGNQLQLRAAARRLAESGEREVIRIDDDRTRVRVWVDEESAGA